MSDNAELEKKLSEEATLKILDKKLSEFFEEAQLNEVLKDADTVDNLQISTINKVISARLGGCCMVAGVGLVCPCPRR